VRGGKRNIGLNRGQPIFMSLEKKKKLSSSHHSTTQAQHFLLFSVYGISTFCSVWGPVHITPEKFENATICGHSGFVFEENSVKETPFSSYGFVWTVDLTEEIKMRFQISPAQCGRCRILIDVLSDRMQTAYSSISCMVQFPATISVFWLIK